MSARKFLGGLAALLFCVMAVAGHASPSPSRSFESLLDEANKIRSSDPRRFIQLLKQLDETSQQADLAQLQRLQYLRAYEMLMSGEQPDIGIAKAKALFSEASDPDLKFRAGALVANSRALSGNFSEGLRFLEKTLPLRRYVQNKDVRHDGINAAGVLYNQLGQYGLGRFYAEETLRDSPNPRARCFASHLRLQSQYRLEKLPQDEASIVSVIQQCDDHGEKILANLVRATLARQWDATGQRDKAINLLQDHLGEVEATGFARLIGETHSLLAELLLAKGDLAGAELHATKTIARRSSLDISLPLVMAYKTRYEIAMRRNDLATALEQYRRYAEADKAYLNEAKARELAYHIVRQESEQKNQQIELLKGQNEVLRLQQRVDRQATQNSRLMVALLALLVASIGYWAYKIKRVHVSLRRFAETDALTGLCNRHHFTLQAEKSIARCAKAGEPVALVMFDLDHFKAVNDNYGHVTGDWVLEQVADTCKAFCRPIDYIGRLGGEEFAILLQGCDLEAATRLAEDCRLAIARIETRDSGHSFRVTASFGVSAASLSDYDLARLLSHADQMLYRAKRDGRNCVRGYVLDTAFAPLPDTSPLRGDTFAPGHAVRSLRP